MELLIWHKIEASGKPETHLVSRPPGTVVSPPIGLASSGAAGKCLMRDKGCYHGKRVAAAFRGSVTEH